MKTNFLSELILLKKTKQTKLFYIAIETQIVPDKYHILYISHVFMFQSSILKRHRQHLPAPKMLLPGHEESYNPPPEYLPTKEEVSSQRSGDLFVPHIMGSWHGNNFYITGPLWGNPVHQLLLDSPLKGSVIFFVVNLNKLLNIQLSCQWFKILWCSCDVTVMVYAVVVRHMLITVYLRIYNWSITLACFKVTWLAHTFAPVPVKQPWGIQLYISYKSIKPWWYEHKTKAQQNSGHIS